MKKLLIFVFFLFALVLIGCSSDADNSDISGNGINGTGTADPTPTPKPTPSPEPPSKPEPRPSPSPKPSPEPSPDPSPEPDPAPEPTPSFGFIDAHADTLSRAIRLGEENKGLFDNPNLHVDFKRLSEFDAPVQVFVAWCPDSWVSTAFERTNYMLDFLEREIVKHSDLIEIALDLDDIRRIAGEGKISAVIAIEGGEALMGKIENLDHFYNRGVRILAPAWNRENALGYGQATGSSKGLKQFGFDCIKRMDELGMILDVSHLNMAGFWDAHNTSTRPYMASHSNAYSVTRHNRNLTDEQIIAIVSRGGIIGFNMYPTVVSSRSYATIDDVMAHFNHLIQIGAGNNIGLGCDLDGVSSLPRGIKDVSSLKILRELLSEEFDEDTSFRIMEGNFYEFFKRYFEGDG